MRVDLPEPTSVSKVPSIAEALEGAQEIAAAAGKFKCRRVTLTDGPQAGVEVVLIDSGRARAAICPTRGMSLWKANLDGVPCGWNSPVHGPIHPNHVALTDSNGLGWLDGFDELLVRCGLRSFGAPDFNESGQLLFPLHGRIGNQLASNLEVHVDEAHSLLEVRGVVRETRFLQYNLQLTAKYVFALGEPTIEIQDEVTNASGTPTSMQMLYHINVGVPVLSQNATLRMAAPTVVARNAHAATDIADWPTYRGPTPGYEEQVYFSSGLPDSAGWAHCLLSSADETQGFAVHYQTDTLPYFTQWKNTVAESDGYVTGLEPGTGFPNPRSFEEEKGRLVELGPGSKVAFQLKLEGLGDPKRISGLASQIASLSPTPIDQKEFDPDWCTPR